MRRMGHDWRKDGWCHGRSGEKTGRRINPEELEAKIEGIMDDADAADEENEVPKLGRHESRKLESF